MPILTVQFVGTCIHFDRTKNSDLGLPVPYRIVIPRTNGPLQVGDCSLSLTPALQLPDGSQISLNGVRMFIEDSGTSAPVVSLPCRPHLKKIWSEMVLNRDVVLNGAPPAAAYFDISSGNIDPFRLELSAGAQLTLDLPSPAALMMESFGTVSRIDITLPSTIVINNYSVLLTNPAPADSASHELALSFLVANELPPPERATNLSNAIGVIIDCLGPTFDYFEVGGPGCSNSQFP